MSNRPAPYLAVWEFLRDDLGVGAQMVDPAVLHSKALDASEIIDAKIGNIYRWREIKRERHRWRGDWLSCTLFKKPARVITRLYVVTGVSGGRKAGVTVTVTPPGQTDGPADLPDEFGDVTLERATNSVQGVSLAAILGTVPLMAVRNPWVEVSYTCGFDGGDPTTDPPTVEAPDGFIKPYPWRIKQACRIIMADLVNADWDNQRGMGKLMALQVGTTSYRRMPIRPHVDYSMPSAALQLLQREASVWLS